MDGRDTERRFARGQVIVLQAVRRASNQRFDRYSAADASARIAWLEDIIRVQLPDVDLDDGPFFPLTTYGDVLRMAQTETGQMISNQPERFSRIPAAAQGDSTPGPTELSYPHAHSDPMRGQKRRHSTVNESSTETSVEEDSRSVALDLGLLSLNSESRQLHYLGSSSGSLFASLFQARKTGGNRFGSSTDAGSSREIVGDFQGESYNAEGSDLSKLDAMRDAANALYTQLHTVRRIALGLKHITYNLSRTFLHANNATFFYSSFSIICIPITRSSISHHLKKL